MVVHHQKHSKTPCFQQRKGNVAQPSVVTSSHITYELFVTIFIAMNLQSIQTGFIARLIDPPLLSTFNQVPVPSFPASALVARYWAKGPQLMD